ncbi:MAG: hypothetical protein WBK76_04885, partial [Candidatus Saccharimonadales bacterium]
MHGQRIGYIRVSTLDQNPDRQLEGAQVSKVFVIFRRRLHQVIGPA